MGLHEMAEYFAEYMPGLKPLMLIPPKRPVRVQVIDDCQIAVAGLRTLLAHWDNLAVSTFIQEGGMMPRLDTDSDIILLDEELDGIRGAQVAERLNDKAFYGIIASIGLCEQPPERIKHLFNRKTRIGRETPDTKDFIFFMNNLIKEVLHNRME